jgi:hypothetical protein
MIFGSLIFLGYWSPRLGILGALINLQPPIAQPLK